MNINKTLGSILIAAGLPVLASAATLASEDFQNSVFVSDAAPSNSDVFVGNTSNGNVVRVVDSSTSPLDAFAGSGNKSIYIHRDAADATLPIFQYVVPGYSTSAPLASGSISFDIYLQTVTNGRNSIEINLGTIASSTSIVGRNSSFASFQINASTATTTGSISYFNNTISGGAISSSSAVMTPNQKNTISVSWSNETKTYSIALNGETIVSSAYTVGSIQGLSSIRFTTVNAATYTDLNYYIDNIVVSDSAIPEPGTTALLVGGAGLMVAIGARRSVR
ncbi:MAG: PEP-CTERM sorting domain-containing protein [Opitutaceae bacterium]|jgi:hypothetical protein